MNVHISYKAGKTPQLEKEFNHHLEKLGRRLQLFRPELVHVHAIVERNATRAGVSINLNLRLPSGQLAAQESASTPVASVKAVFAELLKQLSKHKDLLRSQHKRRQRRLGKEKMESRVPFEKTVAAVRPAAISNGDVTRYVNANLSRLERFVARELRYREASGQLQRGLLTRGEVVDEVICTALGDSEEKPELLSLERWLYRLAMQAIPELAARSHQDLGEELPLEQSARKQNVRASDEPELQYHQPDEMLHR